MDKKQIAKIREFIAPYRITDGKKFKLADIDPGDTLDLDSKKEAREMLDRGVELLSEMQERLYADSRWSLLAVFQAMDAAGKDGTIKHVMSGVNPQGCEVYSFKAPTTNELDHDYLWRCHLRAPSRGRIGIFNRSYYEEVLVVRVHPEILKRQRLHPSLVTDRIWKERYEDIVAFERQLARNGTVIRKFFLHVSRKEQKERFLARLDEPDKHWKFSAADARERQYWDRYMEAYEEMIRHTASEHAPWHVVPADRKWFSRLYVAAVIVESLHALELEFPEVTAAKREELAEARRTLAAED